MSYRLEHLGEGVTLYLGDCRDILSDANIVADAGIFDPPYGTGRYATDEDSAVLPVLRRFVGKIPVAVFGYPEKLCELAIGLGVAPIEWVTWWPTNTQGAARSEKLPRESEHIAFFADAINTSHIKRPRSTHSFARKMAIQRGLDPHFVRDGDVWRDATPGTRDHHAKRQHINEKPVSIIEKIMGCWDVDIFLDAFMGSGTTGVAAVRQGKRFVGIEKVPEHFETAIRRITDELATPDIFRLNGSATPVPAVRREEG